MTNGSIQQGVTFIGWLGAIGTPLVTHASQIPWRERSGTAVSVWV